MATTINLRSFESKDIIPLSTRFSGIYEQKLAIAGNSFLSTLYVESISVGASVFVEYFNTTTDNSTAFALKAHPTLSTAVVNHQLLVTGFNDKPFVRCTVAGGTARFSVYVTVKSSSDVDSAIAVSNANLPSAQKGLAVGGYDSTSDSFKLLPIENDAVKVSGELEVQAPGGLDVYPNGLRVAGRVSIVNLNANTWTALPVVALPQRNAISIQNLSGQPIKINYSPSISGFVGITIADSSERNYNITDTIILYAKCQSGTAQIVVEELS